MKNTRAIFFPQGRLFYGWVVVAVSFVSMAMAYAVWYSFSVFFVAMFQEFGWSRGTTAAAFSVNMIVYGLSAPICGALLDRFGPRVILPAGAFLLAVGLMASSLMNSLWQFYVYYGIIAAVGINLTGTLPNSTVLQHWFSRRRGMALGIASAGIGVGMMVMVPVTQHVITNFGWRAAYQVLAVMALVIVAPLAALFDRHRPQDMGLQPDGVDDGSQEGLQAKIVADRLVIDRAWVSRIWTVRNAARTWRFWLLGLGFITGPLAVQTVLVHQIAFMVDVGYDTMAAAFAFGVVGVIGSICRVVWGYTSDRIGREHAYALGVVFTAAGIAALIASAASGESLWLLIFALLFGIGYAANAPLFPAMVADIFQGRRFGSIYGLLYIGIGVGSGLGPWLGGYSHDITGNYFVAFEVAIVSIVLSAMAFWLASPRKIRTVIGKVS